MIIIIHHSSSFVVVIYHYVPSSFSVHPVTNTHSKQLKESENAWRRSHQAPPFIAGRSFLLSTEGALPVKRLQDMAAVCMMNSPPPFPPPATG